MSDAKMSLPVVRGFGETGRKDLWWVQPLVVFGVLASFVVYATWAAFQNANYTHGNLLSPFYSPVLWANDSNPEHIEHSWFGQKPDWWPWWLFISPAVIILWAPGGFRLTCYYYRGAYYKAFMADPPSCAVGEPRSSYWGERGPLLLQNLHRYFLYLALLFLLFLGWDALKAYRYDGGIGIGVGSLVLTLNVILLGGYTLGCHSFRHLVGGFMDRISGSPTRKKVYDCVSCLNGQHPYWAWFSLIWVMFSDVYVRLCAMGVWHDYHVRIF
jgi:hypothetical protein